MVTVDIITQTGYRFDHAKVREAVTKIITDTGMTSNVEISITLAGERKMRQLHEKYMETDETTDVLSFPLEEGQFPDGVIRLGDIVICYPVAVQQAAENNRMVDEEIVFLAEHGTLHLLGKHHEE